MLLSLQGDARPPIIPLFSLLVCSFWVYYDDDYYYCELLCCLILRTSLSVLGGLTAITLDNLYIRADPVFHYCSNWVMNDSTIKQALGDGIQPGSLRSYRLDSGKLELDQDRNPVWRPPRIQMMFDVAASGPPYRTGLVTCEAIKGGSRWYWPSLQTTLLKVDYETGDEDKGGNTEGDETIFLVGNEEEVTRVSKRSGLSLAMLARSVHINRAVAEVKKDAW
jgi:hypothetical protein